MIVTIIVIASFYTLVYFIGFLTTFRKPWKRTDRQESVSVVLCARNEEKALPGTLESFEAQEYPPELIEWILIDHHSSDSTNNILQEFAARDPRHRKVIRIPDEIGKLRGKAAPWHAGMEAASNEIVLTTGADCRVPPQWIKRTVGLFDDRTQIVSGAALLLYQDRPNGLFARLQNLDMMLIQGFAYCLSALGLGSAGLSNNFALRRSAYMKVGGFPKIGFSICEDVRLSNAIISQYGTKSIRYHLDRESTPTTNPEPLRRLFNMKMRWSMGTRRMGIAGKSLIVGACAIHILLPLLAIFGTVEIACFALWSIAAIWVITSLFVIRIALRMRRFGDIIALPLFLPYFWLYTTIMTPPVVFRLPVRWKGLWVREPA